jgi:hypothetical protein
VRCQVAWPGSGSGSGETDRSKDRHRAPGRLHQPPPARRRCGELSWVPGLAVPVPLHDSRDVLRVTEGPVRRKHPGGDDRAWEHHRRHDLRTRADYRRRPDHRWAVNPATRLDDRVGADEDRPPDDTGGRGIRCVRRQAHAGAAGDDLQVPCEVRGNSPSPAGRRPGVEHAQRVAGHQQPQQEPAGEVDEAFRDQIDHRRVHHPRAQRPEVRADAGARLEVVGCGLGTPEYGWSEEDLRCETRLSDQAGSAERERPRLEQF